MKNKMNLSKEEMKMLINLAKEIYHATSVLNCLNKIGLTAEGDANDDTKIGHHLYATITIAHDAICDVLKINRDTLSFNQKDKIDNLLMDMDATITHLTEINNSNMNDKIIIKSLSYMISIMSKIIETEITLPEE